MLKVAERRKASTILPSGGSRDARTILSTLTPILHIPMMITDTDQPAGMSTTARTPAIQGTDADYSRDTDDPPGVGILKVGREASPPFGVLSKTHPTGPFRSGTERGDGTPRPEPCFPTWYPCLLETLVDDRLAGRLYRPRTDLPALGSTYSRIVHPMGLVLEVGHRLLQTPSEPTAVIAQSSSPATRINTASASLMLQAGETTR